MHDDVTARLLLAAAEQLVADDGVAGLSVRRVAAAAGTSARAVYSLFGSKDGLVAALGAHAFDLLGERVAALGLTDDPAADLVVAGVVGFRPFVLEHPPLFELAVQRVNVPIEVSAQFRGAAARALVQVLLRLERLEAEGLLGGRDVREAAAQFHGLCEGLAGLELRGVLAPDVAEHVWRDGLGALVTGFATPPSATAAAAEATADRG